MAHDTFLIYSFDCEHLVNHLLNVLVSYLFVDFEAALVCLSIPALLALLILVHQTTELICNNLRGLLRQLCT